MSRAVRWWQLLPAFLVLQACAPLQQLNFQARQLAEVTGLVTQLDISRQHGRVLPPGSRLYVSLGNRASEAVETAVSRSVASALHWHFTSVESAIISQTREEAVHAARMHKADYLVYPAVFLWRDEPEAQSRMLSRRMAGRREPAAAGRMLPPDQAAVRLSLIDVRGDVVIDSSTVEVEAPWTTAGQSDLSRLLAASMQRYASTLWMPSIDTRSTSGP